MRSRQTDFSNELYDKIWKTKGSRFNAYERLRKTKRLSYYTTSLLSAYLIIINLLIPFELLPESFEPRFISFASVSLSIILLVFVIMENSMEYSVKGENFHQCSKELSKLFNELHHLLDTENTSNKLVDEIAKRYGEVLDKYDNHSPIDYALLKTKHPKDFDLSQLQRIWIRFKCDYLIHSKYLIFIFVPPLMVMIWILVK